MSGKQPPFLSNKAYTNMGKSKWFRPTAKPRLLNILKKTPLTSLS